MRIPVVLQAPPLAILQRTLEMQSDAASQDAIADVLRSVQGPLRFEIDAGFTPVPIVDEGTRLVPSTNEEANGYLLRGMLDAQGPEDIPERLDDQRVFADALVDVCGCLGAPPIGGRGDVDRLLAVQSLRANGMTGEGVAIAIVDTGIDLDWLEARLGFRPRLDARLSWAPPDVQFEPGGFPTGHGTMCAYAALIAAPEATLIDIPALTGSPPGGAAIGKRVSQVYTAMAPLIAAWTMAFAPTGARPYKSLVMSNSWAMYNPAMDFPPGHPGRYADNPSHFFTATLASLAEAAVDVVFAAGNCGADCPHPRCNGFVSDAITGANASGAVLTIGACDVHGQRMGYSSSGPGIAGMASQKPDLVAYAHFLGSEALGPGFADEGTSTACPIAAGCVASLRTRVDPEDLPAAELFQLLRTTARRSGSWSPEVGFGPIDVEATGRALGLLP